MSEHIINPTREEWPEHAVCAQVGHETWPAHASCNRSAGGKRRAELTNNARQARHIESNKKLGECLRW